MAPNCSILNMKIVARMIYKTRPRGKARAGKCRATTVKERRGCSWRPSLVVKRRVKRRTVERTTLVVREEEDAADASDGGTPGLQQKLPLNAKRARRRSYPLRVRAINAVIQLETYSGLRGGRRAAAEEELKVLDRRHQVFPCADPVVFRGELGID